MTPQLVVLALACAKFSPDQKNSLAQELLSLLPSRVMVLPPTRVSYPGPNFTTSNNFLPADNSMPPLGQFVTLDSFLIFNILQTSSEELNRWFRCPADRWSADPDSPDYLPAFAEFLCFVQNNHWTNDSAERYKFTKDLFTNWISG